MTPRKFIVSAVAVAFFFMVAVPAGEAFFGFGGKGKGKIEEGVKAPPFSGVSLAKEKIDSASIIGKKVVLLDFWSIYCASCIEEMPHLIKLYNDLKDQGLLVLGINMDSFGTRRVVRFIQGFEYKIPYPVIIDRKREIATAFQAMVLPTTIVIDGSGTIRLYHVGYKKGDEKHIREVVEEALKTLKLAEK
ncbi:MAG: TlpA family protein disulfide reductase [Deltaproteobacteria bacterium]|nr:MAG: TlpA family protein disulfide reductase [Deltaproteobacteria bacterium]